MDPIRPNSKCKTRLHHSKRQMPHGVFCTKDKQKVGGVKKKEKKKEEEEKKKSIC